MSKIHVANFVEIRHWIVDDADERDNGFWRTQHRFQNGTPNQVIRHEGQDWKFLSFLYQGATRTRTGDNIEAALVVSTNQISMDYAYDIVVINSNQNQHHVKRQVRVQACLLNSDFTSVNKVFSTENWVAASMNYDEVTVEITLSSAIDAVFAGLPNMYLDENNVGRLPTTARISTT